jgi:hypothetical protein
VRRGPKGADNGGVVELTEGGNSGVAVAVQSADTDTRLRKERRGGGGGDRVLGRVLAREGERGKKKGGSDGAPFIGDAVGSGGRPADDIMWWRGVGEGHGVGMVVGWRAREGHVTGVETGEKRR